MSGAGRKHRAKHLTHQYLDAEAWLGPKDTESLAVCLENPHGQHLRVLVLRLASQLTPREGSTRETTQERSANGEAAPSSSPHGGGGANEEAGECGVGGDRRLTKRLVFLPRKFHKVIWLSIKDVIVVSDSNVQLKPSPEQLANFQKLPENAEYKELITKAQALALENRQAMERAPLHVMSTTTTTSVLPAEQARRQEEEEEDDDDDEEDGLEAEDEHASDGGESDVDSLNGLVNPNRMNIRHRQQFFYMGDDGGQAEEAE